MYRLSIQNQARLHPRDIVLNLMIMNITNMKATTMDSSCRMEFESR